MKATNPKQKGRTAPEMDWVLLSAEGMILPVPLEKKTVKRKGVKVKGIKSKAAQK